MIFTVEKIVKILLSLIFIFNFMIYDLLSYDNKSSNQENYEKTDKLIENEFELYLQSNLSKSYFKYPNKQSITYDDFNIDIEIFSKSSIGNYFAIYDRMIYDYFPARTTYLDDLFINYEMDNRVSSFKEQSFFIEELYGELYNDDLSFIFGKFNPKFSNLFDRKKTNPFTYNFVKSYQAFEKIGYQVNLRFTDKINLAVANFFNDSTILSESSFNNRGKNDLNIYKYPSNDIKLKSYSLLLDMLYYDNLKLIFGYMSEEKSANGVDFDMEENFLFASNYQYYLSIDNFLELNIENNYSYNHNSLNKRDVNFLTLSSSLNLGQKWKLLVTKSIAKIMKNNNLINNQNRDTSYVNYNIRYRFKNNVILDAYRSEVKQVNNDFKSISLILSYLHKF